MAQDPNALLLSRLARPDHPVSAVLDTDAYNEIDDQFAIAYMLRSSDAIRTEALYAAPFLNEKSNSPEEGMEKSYDEILKLLTLADEPRLTNRVYRGSRGFLVDENTPRPSPAVEDLAERAMRASEEEPLYVFAIGAITNVASALLLYPAIARRVVVVWLGGNSLESGSAEEFNMMQDIAAARVLFRSGAAVVQLPCMGVVSHLKISGLDLRHWLMGKNPLADYLAKNTIAAAETYAKGKPWTRVIWDVAPIAWLLSDAFTQSRILPAPLPTYDLRYATDREPQLYRYVLHVNRDAIFDDLFRKLTRAPREGITS